MSDTGCEPGQRRWTRRTALGGAIIAALAAWAALAASSASALTLPPPIYPENGERYPFGTTITGDCFPESPLPATGTNGGYVDRKYTRWELYSPAQRSVGFTLPSAEIMPTNKPSGASPSTDGDWDGPCQAYQRQDNAYANQQYGGTILPSEVGKWRAQYVDHTTRYWFGDPDPPKCNREECGWTSLDSGQDGQPYGIKDFWMYDPCHYVAGTVVGRVLKYQPGRQPQTVRKGTVIGEGDIVKVDGGGRVRLNGQAGNNMGLGPGEYQLSDSKACEELFNGHFAAGPDEPVPVEVKDGQATEGVGDQIQSIIKAGKELFNEGVFSRLKRGSTGHAKASASTATQFRVKRDASRKLTTSCALQGRLRVRTTSQSVPASKRRLILNEGQCALTKDGGAPHLMRSQR